MNTERTYWLYILASDVGGTLYVGVTNDLIRRVHEHRTGAIAGFSRTHAVHRLVYFEPFDQIEFAIKREKRIKKSKRDWKVALIERDNPNWSDLFPSIASP
jgi:putative endonuclease